MVASVFANPGFYMTFAVIQALGLLFLIQLLDPFKRRPIFLIVLLALWGATGAAALALTINRSVRRWVPGSAGVVFGDAIGPPLVEECTKGLALLAAFLVLRRLARRMDVSLFEGPMDGIVYGAAVGLGFGFTEDFFYFVERARTQGVDQALHVFVDRRDFFGPAMLHHPLFTAAFGAGLGFASWASGRVRQLAWAALGLTVAIAMHAVNNGFVETVLTVRYGLVAAAAWEQDFAVAPGVAHTGDAMLGVLRLLDFVYAAVFIAAILLWQRHQRRLLDRELEEEVQSGLIGPEDKESVLHVRRRWLTSWNLLRRGLPEQWRARRRLDIELVELARLKWRLRRSGGDWARVKMSRRRVVSLKTLGATPSDLPLPASRLVGRERELAETAALLRRREVRVLTLVGPGGIGKTRLALELASGVADEFASGAVFVSLAAVHDLALVSGTVAHALELRELPGQPLEASLRDYLRDKQLLLVLDNFEHVLASAPLVGELVAAAPALKVLATSRAPLRVAGEQEYELPPLSLPAAGTAPDAEALQGYDAVALFVERARAVTQDFALTDRNKAPVLEICRRLDGLPLAIELAAARTRLLDPAGLLERLGQRLDLLAGGASDLPERQRTLRSAIEWSYDLLGPTEKALFARLSVFRGAWALDAAEQVCRREAELPVQFLESVESLVENSLVERRRPEAGEPRFGMLQTIREYALERLDEQGELEEVHRALGHHYLSLAEEAARELSGPDQREWLGRLASDYSNMRGALSALLRLGDNEAALRLGSMLVRFWEARGSLSEGRSWLEDALAGGDVGAPARAAGLRGVGRLALLQADYERAQETLNESLSLSRSLTDEDGSALALALLGQVATARRDYGRATALGEEAASLAQKLADRDLLAIALSALAGTASRQRDYVRARELFERSLALRSELGDQAGIANSLLNLGWVALLEDEFARADEFLNESLEVCRDLGDLANTALCLANLGLSAVRQEELTRAEEQLQESLSLCARLMDRQTAAECLCGLAGVVAARGEAARAAQYAGAAEALRERVDVSLWPVEVAIFERYVYPLEEQLGEEAFARAWRLGRGLETEILRMLSDESRLRRRTLTSFQRVILERPPDAARMG
jgi:predicted ATPase/RsiW-degrading membrane proteinase PrsW (M82 family)